MSLKLSPMVTFSGVGHFSNLEAAETRINELLASDPSEYFIHCHPTGQKLSAGRMDTTEQSK